MSTIRAQGFLPQFAFDAASFASPGGPGLAPGFHVGAAGDTLESIARAVLGNAGLLSLLEQLNPRLAGRTLSDGSIVRLPSSGVQQFLAQDPDALRRILGDTARLAADPRVGAGGAAAPGLTDLVQALRVQANVGGGARGPEDPLGRTLAGLTGLSAQDAARLRASLGDGKLGEFLDSMRGSGFTAAESGQVLNNVAAGRTFEEAVGGVAGSASFLQRGVTADRVLAFITEKLPQKSVDVVNQAFDAKDPLGNFQVQGGANFGPPEVGGWRTAGLTPAEMDKVSAAVAGGKSLEDAVRGVTNNKDFVLDDFSFTRALQWARQQLPDNLKVAGGGVGAAGQVADIHGTFGDVNNISGSGQVKLLGYEAGAGWGVYANARDLKFGVAASAEAQAYIVDAQGRITKNWGWGQTQLDATARVGARAGANANVIVDPLNGTVALKVGAEAFVGARAGVSLSQTVGPVGVHAGVQAQVGIGANFNLDVGLRDGKFGFKLDVGAALGIGIRLQLGFDIDFKAIGKKVVEWGKKGWEGIKNVGAKVAEGVQWLGDKIGEGAKKVGNAIADGAKAVGNAIADGAKSVGNAIASVFKGW